MEETFNNYLLFFFSLYGFTYPKATSSKLLKGAVSRAFLPLFFSLIKPIWSPDKQAKMVFLKIRFRKDIRFFFKASPLKSYSKMWALVCIVHLWIRFLV